MLQMTDLELRIRRLEEAINRILAALKDIAHKASQALQNSYMDSGSNRGGSGARRAYAQADGDIGGAGTNDFGTGNAFLLQNIAGSRYQLDPPRSVPVLNSTTGTIDDKTYLELILDGGEYSVIVANCSAAADKAPDPPG